MSDITQLAAGTFNGDQLTIQLLRKEDLSAANRTPQPAAVRILWPPQPSIIDANAFGDVAAVGVKIFSTAAVELASIRARQRGLL
jgi:hypothetical protein